MISTVHNVALSLCLGLSVLCAPGCNDSASSSASSASSGSTGAGATATAPTPEAAAWGTALATWPQRGDPGRLAKLPLEKSGYDLWNDIRIPPIDNAPSEYIVVIIDNTKPLLDPLHALKGGWAAPVSSGNRISSRSLRGLAKSIWADLRLALNRGDRDRAVGDLVLLATLPRVAREVDPTDRGLTPTLGVAAMFGWGLVDLDRGGAPFKPTAEQCARIRTASSWLNESEPFGRITPENLRMWGAFEERELPLLRKNVARLCSDS